MCGIYGFLGKSDKNTASNIQCLGVLNVQRGQDSTGIAIISQKNTNIFKKDVDSLTFFGKQTTQKAIGIADSSQFLAILGHTRLATRGAISKRNAHPFKNGRIVFTHNGGIYNFDSLQKEFNTSFEVDSQIIGHLIRYKGIDRALETLSGSFTIPFIDLQKRNVLQVAVHNQVFAYAIKKDQLYYSSDINHLKEALKFETGFTFHNGISNQLYTFTFKNGVITPKITHFRASDSHSYLYNYAYSHGWDLYGF